MYFSYSVKTNVGRKRDHNEDFVTCFDPVDEHDLQRSGRLFIVADGVGGASHGERASKYAAEKVLYDYYNFSDIPPGPRLQQIIQDTGNQINTFAEEGERFIRMATTMVVAAIIEDSLIVANVGDSRAYLIRAGVANQISKDHSFVGEMVRDGLMTEEEARTSKQKNRITRSLGGERDVRVDVFEGIKLADGDKILLCSDGFSQYATNEMIVHLAQNGTADEITDRMIVHANQQGGSDNISVILIKVSSSELAETLSANHLNLALPDWDKMDTEHGDDEIGTGDINSFVEFAGLKLEKKTVYIFLAVFLASAILGVFIFNRLIAPPPPPTLMNSSSPEVMEGPVAVPTVTPAPYPNRCRYTLTSDDVVNFKDNMLGLLADRFSIDTKQYNDNQGHEKLATLVVCSYIENNQLCKYGAYWMGHYNISQFEAGWTIEFPLVELGVTKDVCEQGGGSTVFISNPSPQYPNDN